METKKYTSIEEYLSSFPTEIVEILVKIKSTIETAAPLAESCIAYNMPAFKLNKKPLVYFAAFAHHIGFYALPSGNIAFKESLSKYKTGKGSIQFPLHDEIPYDLIGQITKARVEEVSIGLNKLNH